MNWMVNQVIEWLDENGDPVTERLLWIDSTYTDAYLFDLRDPKAMPVWRRIQDLEGAISQGIVRVLSVDPYLIGMRPDDTLSDMQRRQRDQAWGVIQPLVQRDDEEIIFQAKTRGILISEAIERTGISKPTIYNYLRKYWRGGQTKNALVPDFDLRGGRGKAKSSGERKRGRPARRTRTMTSDVGINVDDLVREKFRRGIRLFYETGKERSFTEAYQLMLERLFHQGYEKQGETLVPKLPPATELPTLR